MPTSLYDWFYNHWFSHWDAELIHDRVLKGLTLFNQPPLDAMLSTLYAVPTDPLFVTSCCGLSFVHPLGLAGGFDKDAMAPRALAALGFSFLELGTVTPRPQTGNPRPRIFRLLQDQALINRMGFPNHGAAVLADRLKQQRVSVPLAISLGKQKDTPLIQAQRDYVAVLREVYTVGDCFVINISSPNTPELRQLQTPAYLGELLTNLIAEISALASNQRPKPLLVKIAPDLEWDELDTILELVLEHGISGIVATNTTLARDGLYSPYRAESGGLSGRPLRQRSTTIIRHIYQSTNGKLPIIGVGGIFSAQDAWDKLAAGATLLQAYTGFIYRGPSFAKQICMGLRTMLKRNGLQQVSELVGSGLEYK